jgi:hypothetical protein
MAETKKDALLAFDGFIETGEILPRVRQGLSAGGSEGLQP